MSTLRGVRIFRNKDGRVRMICAYDVDGRRRKEMVSVPVGAKLSRVLEQTYGTGPPAIAGSRLEAPEI